MANFYASYPFVPSAGGGGGGGTVTSVGLADGSTTPIFNISGSPVTTSGTLTETLKTQSAHAVFAGPTSGSAVQPTFRALVAGDLPAGTGTVTSVAMTVPSVLSISGSPITTSGTLAVGYSGTALPTANGGTGLTSPGTSGNVLTSNGTIWTSAAPSGGGSFVQIQKIVADGTFGAISFTSISQTYTNLKIVFKAQSQAALIGAPDQIDIMFNSDASADYNWCQLFGGNGTPGSNNNQGDLQIAIPGAATKVAPANSYAETGDITIGSYTDGFFKTLTGTQSVTYLTTFGNISYIDSCSFSGSWEGTDPITRIDLVLDSGSNYTSGSVFTLYGML